EYYPETTEEHARFNIIPTWFFIHEMKTDLPQFVQMEFLEFIVREKKIFEPFVVPMAFFREAKNEHSASRYIDSIFKSYFILDVTEHVKTKKNKHAKRRKINRCRSSPMAAHFEAEY